MNFDDYYDDEFGPKRIPGENGLFEGPEASLVKKQLLRNLVGLVVFTLVVIAIFLWGSDDWKQVVDRLGPAVVMFVWLRYLASVARSSGSYRSIRITGFGLKLRNGDSVVDLAPEDVRLLLAGGGVSFDGGEMFIWKYIYLATEKATYKLLLFEEDKEVAFDRLAEACPNALCVPFNGPIVPGAGLRRTKLSAGDPARLSHEWMRPWAGVCNRMLVRGVGLLLAALAAGTLGGFLVPTDKQMFGIGLIVLFFVLFVAAAMAGRSALAMIIRRYRVAWRFGRAVGEALQLGKDVCLGPELFAHAPKKPSCGTSRTVLAVLGGLLFWVPVVGVAVWYGPYKQSRGSSGLFDRMSKLGFWGSFVVTLGFVVFVLSPWIRGFRF